MSFFSKGSIFVQKRGPKLIENRVQKVIKNWLKTVSKKWSKRTPFWCQKSGQKWRKVEKSTFHRFLAETPMKCPFFRKMGFFSKNRQNDDFRVFRSERFSWKRRKMFFVLNVKRSPFWKKNLPGKHKSPLLILIYIIVAWNFLIGIGKHKNGLPKLTFWTKNNPPFLVSK